jgi:hypothetical protein
MGPLSRETDKINNRDGEENLVYQLKIWRKWWLFPWVHTRGKLVCMLQGSNSISILALVNWLPVLRKSKDTQRSKHARQIIR